MKIGTSGENETEEPEAEMNPVHVPIEQEIRAEWQGTQIVYHFYLLFMLDLCIQVNIYLFIINTIPKKLINIYYAHICRMLQQHSVYLMRYGYFILYILDFI